MRGGLLRGMCLVGIVVGCKEGEASRWKKRVGCVYVYIFRRWSVFLSEHDCIAKVQEIERIQTKYFFAFNFLLQDTNHLCNIIYRSL
jgi:hypothetical protein